MHDNRKKKYFYIQILVYIIVAFIYHQFLVELFTDLT